MSDEVKAGSAEGIPAVAAGNAATEGGIRAAAEGPVRAVAAELQAKFSFPEGALKVQRATRLWVEVDRSSFGQVFDHLVKGMGFSILCTITGLDLGTDLGFIYHLARDGGIMANVKTRVPKGESIKSVTPYFPGADIYESELQDLLGARVEGKPVSPRYPLPEDWPQGDHPLLKDWKPKDAAAAAAPASAPAAAPAEKGAVPNA
jgi:Ni,Fe-hydrogenase III component G